MQRGAIIGLGLVAVLSAATGAYLFAHRAPSANDHWALVDRYCVGCHNDTELAGDLAFDRMNRANLGTDAAVWETAIRKLRGHLMPPPGEPRPPQARVDALVSWLEESLDAAARTAPNPGAPALHRLNRAEYANAVRDLLDVTVDATTLLPADDSSAGFDNVASALSVSPALLSSYVAAAARISRLAVGDPSASSSVVAYRAPRGLVQAEHLDGQPLGTRGGMSIRHFFPLDAEYEIRVARGGGGFGLEALGADEEVEITVNGERAAILGRGGPRTAVLRVPAGPQTLGAAIVRKRDAQGVDDLFAVHAPTPGVTSLSIVGPRDASGVGDTPSRRRIFVCSPADASEDADAGRDARGRATQGAVAEAACAADILRRLAERAYRRPMRSDDRAVATLLTFYSAGREQGTFDAGIQRAVARVLVDPEFIFRFEAEPADLPPGSAYRIGDIELASRLSFFLWSSIPDEPLLAAAAAGELSHPEILEREVRRMLADPKADALVVNFASQWLGLRQLDSANPTSSEFDGNLRLGLRRETELLFASVLREDATVVELLSADYTFVDERLARHYGIPNVRGSRFRRVELADDARRGLLGHGSVLTVTSAPNRTSPVKRGQWVLANVLGTPAPPPPDNVETNLDETAPAGLATTMRERLTRHMADPGCAACHNLMDPLGFALENFDFTGQWREAEGGRPVDARGVFVDGSALSGPAGLRNVLLEQREMFVQTFAEKLLTYAMGRSLAADDMPAVREIVRRAARDDYRLSALVLGVAASVPMQMRSSAATQGAVADAGSDAAE
jgi:mono/diheme cytochrome c family protein